MSVNYLSGILIGITLFLCYFEWNVFLISFSLCSLLICTNEIDIFTLTLGFVTLLDSSNCILLRIFFRQDCVFGKYVLLSNLNIYYFFFLPDGTD
jgi:hypothetical protein